MSVGRRPVIGTVRSVDPASPASIVISAALRAVSALAAGFALVGGASLVLWAFTPTAAADTSDALDALTGGAVAFAAAHFLPVTISGAALTLRPLLLTGIVIAIIATAVGRGRAVRGRGLEALHAAVFVVLYAVGVGALSALVAPSGVVGSRPGAPLAIAGVVAIVSLFGGPTAWRRWWECAAPEWLGASVRAAWVAVLALTCGAALLLAIGIAVSFPTALVVSELTVHSLGDAFGMTLLALVFVPNAVIAALGYASGAGFSIGAASFSPLVVHTADLPAIPLLAAAPAGQPSALAWASFAVPVLAAVIAAAVLRGVGRSRAERIAAVALTAAVVGLVGMLLAWAGGGGVPGGAWATMGAPPMLTGGLLAGINALVAGALLIPKGWAQLPWRLDADEVDATTDEVAAPDEVETGLDSTATDGSESQGTQTDVAGSEPEAPGPESVNEEATR